MASFDPQRVDPQPTEPKGHKDFRPHFFTGK